MKSSPLFDKISHLNPITTDNTKLSMRRWHWCAIGIVLLLTAFLNFFRLGDIGYGNNYYAVGVKSMLLSWHNFFFVSFDPGGFVTIDKPPLGFWIQALSARVFGFTGFALFLPEALAGMLAVALLFHLVQRVFGPEAGILAALVLALTPISIVTNRNNTIDSLLVLTTLLATWTLLLATETGRLRWLLICALLVGLGFNIKMLEAYLVLPAFGLTYLLGTGLKWRKRIVHLGIAVILLGIVSLSWVTIVDLTPASQRPYVGSSGINSELNLAIGYNGIQRLLGRGGHPSQPHTVTETRTHTTPPPEPKLSPQAEQALERQVNAGQPGPLRFYQPQLGGQISWLLPLALLSLLAIDWQTRGRLPLNRRQQGLVLWGIWLITMLVFFSRAEFFNIYYLVMMAPAIGALVGIGVVSMWQDYRRTGWQGWLLPLALIITTLVQTHLLSNYPEWTNTLTLPILIISILVVGVLIIARSITWLHKGPKPAIIVDPTLVATVKITRSGLASKQFLLGLVVCLEMVTLLAAPAIWGGTPALFRTTSQPSAGPVTPDPPGRRASTHEDALGRLVQYLLANQGHHRYMLGTSNAGTAEPFIMATGEPVMALGGFSGNDRILTPQRLSTLIAKGEVRFFLLQISPQTPVAPKKSAKTKIALPPQTEATIDYKLIVAGSNGDIVTWIGKHCSVLPATAWQTDITHTTPYGGNSLRLFDCAAQH